VKTTVPVVQQPHAHCCRQKIVTFTVAFDKLGAPDLPIELILRVTCKRHFVETASKVKGTDDWKSGPAMTKLPEYAPKVMPLVGVKAKSPNCLPATAHQRWAVTTRARTRRQQHLQAAAVGSPTFSKRGNQSLRS